MKLSSVEPKDMPAAGSGGNTNGRARYVRRLVGWPVADAGLAPGYGAMFNPGLMFHEGEFHLFARAVRSGYRRNPAPGDRFVDYLSDIVVLTSKDGIRYRFGYVLAPAGTSGAACFEDPRVQRVATPTGEAVVMTYTFLPPAGSGKPWRIGAHKLSWSEGRFWLQAGSGRILGPEGVPDKDAVVFSLTDGRVALVHRVHPNIQIAIFDDLDELFDPREGYWPSYMEDLASHTLLAPSRGALGVGAGAPPVETEKGLLFFFHERRADGSYTMNLALLDPSTGQVLSRLPGAVLEPEMPWERHGDVDEVVFVQGAHRDRDTLYLTYGAADRYVGAATASVSELLSALAEAA